MSDDQKERAAAEGWMPTYPPPPEAYLSGGGGAVSGGAPDAAPAETGVTPPRWPGQPDVYPPPPEMYLEAAKAAPTFVTPSYSSPYEASQARPAPARPRRRWLRIRLRAAGQPITEWDIALTFLSAAVSFVVYAVILTWPVGLGLTLLIFLHEMGHFVVIRAKGMPARLPIFIPLVGAFVLMGQGPMDARDEAEISLAGPFAGLLGSVVCLAAYWLTQNPTFFVVAELNLLINLFNLLPLGPLDGGRATRAISKWLLAPWLLLVVIGSLCTVDILLILLAGAAFVQVVFLRDRDPGMIYYQRTPRRERRYVTTLYFGLCAAMIATAVAGLALTGGLEILRYLPYLFFR